MPGHPAAAAGRRPIVYAVLALGFALTLHELGHDSLWSDEIVSAQLAGFPFGRMWSEMTANVNHLPLHYLLQWLASPFGTSEFGLRLPSAMLATASVAGAYRLGRELLDRNAGLAAMALTATHHYHLWAAQEARYYALIGLWAVLGAAALLRLLRRPDRRAAVLFVVAAAGALYTHAFCLLTVASAGAASLAVLLYRRLRRLRIEPHLPLAWAAVAVLALPAVPSYLRLARFEEGGSGRVLTLPLLRALWLEYGSRSTAVAALFLALALLGLIAAGRRRPGAAWVAAMWFAPLPALMAVSSTHFFLIKYLHHLFPLYIGLVGAGAAWMAGRLARAARASPGVAGLAALVAVANLPAAQAYYRMEKFDWRAATAYVAQRALPTDAVVLLPPAMPEMDWYYPPEARAARLVPFGYGRGSVAALREAETAGGGFYWLVLTPTGRVDWGEQLGSAFEVRPYFGVLVLESRVAPIEGAKLILPLFAAGLGCDAVLAAPAWDTLGAIRESEGDVAGAADAYTRALSCYHERRARSRLAGDLARLSGDWAAALAHYEAAAQPAPDVAEVYLHLGRARRIAGDDPGAVAAYLAYRRLTGHLDAGLRLVADLHAELPDAEREAPATPLDTPFCRDDAASCYLAATTFTLPGTGEARNAIFSHPDSALEYRLELPATPAVLVTSPLLDPRSWGWGGDGVTFRVSLRAGDGPPQVLGERHVTSADRDWQDWLLSLAPWAGQAVWLRLETGPGPSGDYSGDWAGWGEPLVLTFREEPG